MSWTKNSFFSQSRPDSYSDDDCWASLITSNQFLLGFFQVLELLHVACRCSNITAAAVAISFQPKKKSWAKTSFFFFFLIIIILFIFKICRDRTDENPHLVCCRTKNLKWTELNWNRTTCFEIIISFLSFHINQVTFDLIDFIWFSTIFQSFATYTRQLIRRLSNKNHQKIFFLTKIFQQKQNKKNNRQVKDGQTHTHTRH